jgi:hypothetical protein
MVGAPLPLAIVVLALTTPPAAVAVEHVFAQPIAQTGCTVVAGTVRFGSFDGRVWRLAGPGNASEVARFPSGVTDVALGPDGLVHVATAGAISTIDPAVVVGSAGPPDDGATSLAGDDDRDVQGWVAVIAAVVLAGALIARVVAGRRARPPH